MQVFHFTEGQKKRYHFPFFSFPWQIKPLSVKYGLGISDHDSEGRLVTVEFDSFYLLSSYVPNSGDGLRRLVKNSQTLVFCFYLVCMILVE